jgi:hypothetical protein
VYAAQRRFEEARGEWIAARKLAPPDSASPLSVYGKEADKLLKEK